MNEKTCFLVLLCHGPTVMCCRMGPVFPSSNRLAKAPPCHTHTFPGCREEEGPSRILNHSFPTRRSTWHFQKLDSLRGRRRGWSGAQSALLRPLLLPLTPPSRLPLGQTWEQVLPSPSASRCPLPALPPLAGFHRWRRRPGCQEGWGCQAGPTAE